MEIYVAKSGQQTGPFSPQQLQSMLNSGMVSLTDSAWREGLESWLPLHQVLNVGPPLPGTNETPQLPTAAGQAVSLSASRPASFGIRLGAHIIDAIICYILAFVGGFVVGVVLSVSGAPRDALQLAGFTVGVVSGWLYYALMESSTKQATLGKMACGIVVTDLQGERISFGQASGRYFGMIVSTLTLGVGHLMCIWTDRRQCLHDMMAGCLVRQK